MTPDPDHIDPAAAGGDPAPGFHMLAKPGGSSCNIDCSYCFFLSKEALYPERRQHMSDQTLETYIRQLLQAHTSAQVQVAWQGGEPTLMQLPFFARAVELVEQYRRPDQVVEHSIQTNGTLIDEDWCRFLKQHRFLVGLSVDGPRALHDRYRVDRLGQGTFERVMRGWRLLRSHGVACNILCTVNAANQDHGRTVYRFLRDELQAEWLQFIPIVERATAQTIELANQGWRTTTARGKRPLYTQSGDLVTQRSVGATQYGRFLVDVFEEWVRHDVGRVFVRDFDVALEACFGRHGLCVHAPECGYGPALEHNGDLYCCDHYVEPGYRLGNIHEAPLRTLVFGSRQRAFVQHKRSALPASCLTCAVRPWCHGGCPKDRFVRSADADQATNYLCDGYRLFFSHIQPALRHMVERLQQGRPPADVMAWKARQDADGGPYQPCACGSGHKLRFCHGNRAPPSPFQDAAGNPGATGQGLT